MWRLLRFRILFAVAGILCAMVAVHHAMHVTEGLQGARTDAPLAAADYRAPIARLEARLFGPAPLDRVERIALARDFDEVRKRLGARGASHMARYSARELGTLAAMSRGLGELGGADLDRVRTNWMRIRANTFDDASWFRFSESDPPASETETAIVLGEAERAWCGELRRSLDRVEQAIERGERDAAWLGEPGDPATFTSADRERLAAAWADWGGSWRSELDGIRDWLPGAPAAEAPTPLRFARDGALRALERLASLPGASSRAIPYRQEWTRCFEAARKQVRDARGWLDRAERGLGV